MTDGNRFGSIVAIDLAERTVDVKKGGVVADKHPSAVFAHTVVSGAVKAEALFRVAMWVARNGIGAEGSYQAGRDLLLRQPPRFSDGSELPAIDEADMVRTACGLGSRLQDSVLAIQGPPGSGKTYTAAQMAITLLKEGRTVGVTAVSHKVIRYLLEWISKAAAEAGVEARCIHKVTKRSGRAAPGINETTSNAAVLRAIEDREANVVGGTSWLWARDDMAEAVDVVFVDEAGQLSLADSVAVSRGAKSLVLLGDPRQLDQPQQGSHPEGTEVPALEHLLAGQKTMPSDRGLFLSQTRRLAPAICAFTSELFYENRLQSYPGLERQMLEGGGSISGAGLWFAATPHEGNQSSSPEEVIRVVELFEQLTSGDMTWVNEEGESKVLTSADVLIVAPYNAQVSDLMQALPAAHVGTVDKFQGQEAPVVIYSMTSSSPADAPHGMEFLYSLNRLNVATSRARCACILVASPRLFEPDCRTPEQMRLANAFCRYLEMAQIV